MAKTKVMVGIRFAAAVANDAEVKAKPRSENCCPRVPLFLENIQIFVQVYLETNMFSIISTS